MIRKLALILFFIVPVPLLAQICPVSNKVPTPDDGIGDGCSTKYNGIDLAWLVPDVGLFKSTFTPACDFHDKCWTQLGADYESCNSQFLSKMKDRCDSKYDPIFLAPINLQCKVAANMYKQAVDWYLGHYPEIVPGFQYEALNRSYGLRATVEADGCGTTPERTTLYAPGLITRVNNSFQSYAGRRPTIYEFLDAVNWQSGTQNLVSDDASWSSALYNKSVAAASAFPPSVGWWLDFPDYSYAFTFRATPVLSGASYLWKIGTTGSGPALALSYFPPQYDRKITFSGFLKATGSNGARNMALVETSVTLAGLCASKPGPNVHCN
jgi:hypothetical protein